MLQRQRKPLLPTLIEAIVIGLPVIASFIALVVGSMKLQRSFCPPDTLVSGHLVGLLLMVGLIGLWSAGVLLFGYGFRRRPYRPGKSASPAAVRSLCIAILIPSALAWVDGLYTYYCVTPAVIIVHPDPLMDPVEYSWSDVTRLSVGCTRGKSTGTLFDLHLKDGRSLGLGGDSWSMTLAHYDSIIAALRRTPYVYDTQGLKGCPPEYWDRFENKPG